MRPLAAFVAFAIGGGLYHAAKSLLGFDPQLTDYIMSLYWVGGCLLMVAFGWVRA